MPEGGGVFDVFGYGFRHEPSLDPMRMQSFRMHEFVYVANARRRPGIPRHLARHAIATLASLGLPITQVAANDPFFGRAGKMLISAQLRENLKIELTVPIYGDLHEGTAIASANCQRDHLTAAFGIRTADGEVAHAACLAFGMERTVLALLRTHGLDVTAWPADYGRDSGLAMIDTWFGGRGLPRPSVSCMCPDGGARGGVVICPPLGYEQFIAYRAMRFLGQELDERRLASLRFDYVGRGRRHRRAGGPGCGGALAGHDRAGGAHPASAGVERVVFAGLAAGALLAAEAARRLRASRRSASTARAVGPAALAASVSCDASVPSST